MNYLKKLLSKDLYIMMESAPRPKGYKVSIIRSDLIFLVMIYNASSQNILNLEAILKERQKITISLNLLSSSFKNVLRVEPIIHPILISDLIIKYCSLTTAHLRFTLMSNPTTKQLKILFMTTKLKTLNPNRL